MSTHPIIYVSRITNLSDARYCAGMGVDLLGFVIDPSDPDFVSAASYQEMIGWISGPARVVENHTLTLDDKFMTDYSPEFLHQSFDQLQKYPASAKRIVEVPFGDIGKLEAAALNRIDIAYWLLTGVPDDFKTKLPFAAPVLIAKQRFTVPIIDYLTKTGAAGIALQGSPESVPGLKDYDHLAQVLEELNT